MKLLLPLLLLTAAAFLAACEPSGTAKKEMEKFSGTRTPYPSISPTPEPTPIDPAYVVQVDTSLDGDNLTVNGDKQTKTVDCTKYNNVMINGNNSLVTVKGACRRVSINGDGADVRADAATEFMFNGTMSTLTYSRFVNGKEPIITQNSPGNDVKHVPAEPAKKK